MILINIVHYMMALVKQLTINATVQDFQIIRAYVFPFMYLVARLKIIVQIK